MPKRLKAFTLLELLVAMAITGIVISISGIVYNMLGRQFHSFHEANERISSAFALHSRLSSDFINASLIELNEEGMLVRQANKEPVQYRFTDKAIMRIDQYRTDTFRVGAEEVKFYSREEVKEEGLVDELHFSATVLEQPETFRFIKQYGITEELNRED